MYNGANVNLTNTRNVMVTWHEPTLRGARLEIFLKGEDDLKVGGKHSNWFGMTTLTITSGFKNRDLRRLLDLPEVIDAKKVCLAEHSKKALELLQAGDNIVVLSPLWSVPTSGLDFLPSSYSTVVSGAGKIFISAHYRSTALIRAMKNDGWHIYMRDASIAHAVAAQNRVTTILRPDFVTETRAYHNALTRLTSQGLVEGLLRIPDVGFTRGLRRVMEGKPLIQSCNKGVVWGIPLVVVGPPGSGKSAIVRNLRSKKYDIRSIESDELYPSEVREELAAIFSSGDNLYELYPQDDTPLREAYNAWVDKHMKYFTSAPECDIYFVHTMVEASVLPLPNRQVVFLTVDENIQMNVILGRDSNNDWRNVLLGRVLSRMMLASIHNEPSGSWLEVSQMLLDARAAYEAEDEKPNSE